MLICLVLLPNLYMYLVLSKTHAPPTPLLYLHVISNCCANLLVVVGAWGGAGRLDQRLAGALMAPLWAHGLLALVIVLTHSQYSVTVMAPAALASVLLGLASAAVSHAISRPRIAVVGPVDELAGQIPRYAEHVLEPDADLRRFDVVLTTFKEQPPEWSRFFLRAMLAGKRVRHASEYLEEARGLVLPEHFEPDQLPVGALATWQGGKRAMDLAISLALLPFALPVLLAAALAIRLFMGGPVLFRQWRVGLGGRPFQMLKLRTMTLGPASYEGHSTRRGDPRVTSLGRWLRRLHIDELPQLWHVLVGEMSLIGPRPEWMELAADYVEQLPVYAYRHLVRPGVTGWAQVRSGYAGDLRETRLKLAYDLFYVKHLSLALDLQILARTAWILVTGAGSR